MELIDREDHQKLYLQLYEILKKKIESSEWPLGSQIPTEDDLCKMFAVSRATVRTAILELVRHGYLKRQQGKGTFVFRSAVSDGLNMFTNFRDILFEEDINLVAAVLARTVMMPVNDLNAKLDIPRDRHIIYVKRLFSADNEPVLLQESFIPYHICPLLLEEDIGQNSLSDLFERKFGIKISKVRNYMEIAHLSADESRLIGLSEKSSAILLNQYFYSGETLVMYVRSIKRTDKYKFLIELERKAT
jgi:GntR family transcriptional regulator